MKRFIYSFLVFSFCIIFTQCKEKTESAPDVGYGYFPTTQKLYVIYQVDSVYYDSFTVTVDSFSYQVKEIIESEIIDNSGRKTSRIERYYRKDSNSDWEIKDVWVANKTNQQVEKTEENIKYVKLAFPVKQGTVWNGNLYNTLGRQDYKYQELHTAFSINSLSFDSTVTVLQVADSSLIEKKYAYEIYAKNVGLIYKKFVDVKDQDSQIDFSLTFNQRIDTGTDYTYKIISYGVE